MTEGKPIGVFDSGYGGLTVLKEFINILPEYDLLYLGDNARAPYGSRSYETVYQYTLECVKWLFMQGCELVILACNTASAKALRTIQQNDLWKIDPAKKVLGVIRPTAEIIGNFTKSGEIGVLGTDGTIKSNSYVIEINKFFPKIKVHQQSCPLWVPLVENNLYETNGADYFIKNCIDEIMSASQNIDVVLLACTHYPLLIDKINKHVPAGIKIVSQGEIVAASLRNYLYRHPEIDIRLSKNSTVNFYTTDAVADFDKHSSIFFGKAVQSRHVTFKLVNKFL